MWTIPNLTLKNAIFDFSSSRQPDATTRQLWDGNTQLVNALERVNWGEPELQFEICEQCGIAGCKPQGWVELKRSQNLALITPTFTRLKEAPDNLRDEYLPPAYLYKGAIVLENYDELRQLAPFPEFETLAPLQAWEAVKLFQLEAPNQVLGNLRDQPKLDRDLILASSEGSFIEQIPELVALLNQKPQFVQLRKITELDRIITFYLDLAGVPQWNALIYNDRHYSLYLEPDYVIELDP